MSPPKAGSVAGPDRDPLRDISTRSPWDLPADRGRDALDTSRGRNVRLALRPHVRISRERRDADNQDKSEPQ